MKSASAWVPFLAFDERSNKKESPVGDFFDFSSLTVVHNVDDAWSKEKEKKIIVFYCFIRRVKVRGQNARKLSLFLLNLSQSNGSRVSIARQIRFHHHEQRFFVLKEKNKRLETKHENDAKSLQVTILLPLSLVSSLWTKSWLEYSKCNQVWRQNESPRNSSQDSFLVFIRMFRAVIPFTPFLTVFIRSVYFISISCPSLLLL